MNKRQMADRLAARTGPNKTAARDAVDGVFETIGEALANGEEVRIAGFGSFGTRSRPARTVPAAIQGPAARFDIGVEVSVLRGWYDAQGFAQCRSEDVDGG